MLAMCRTCCDYARGNVGGTPSPTLPRFAGEGVLGLLRQSILESAQAEIVADDAEAGDHALAYRRGFRYRAAAHRVRHVQLDGGELHLVEGGDQRGVAAR